METYCFVRPFFLQQQVTVLRQDEIQAFSNDVWEFTAKHVCKGLVRSQYPFRVMNRNALEGGIGQLMEPFFAFPPSLFCTLALGNVPDIFDHTFHPARIRVFEWEGEDLQPPLHPFLCRVGHYLHGGLAVFQGLEARANITLSIASMVCLIALLARERHLVGIHFLHGLINKKDIQIAVKDTDPVLNTVEDVIEK